MPRIILHLDMDAFFAQLEERENPRFKGKPVVVGADPKSGRGRGVVSTANYEARKYGIHSALPISKAYSLCPSAIFLPVNMELYQRVSQQIMETVKKYSSIWQIASLDEAYLDLSHLSDYAQAETSAKKLKDEILEKQKLTATCGLGPNKLIAKIATNQAKPGTVLYLAKPNGFLAVKPQEVSDFLAPLGIRELPGIGPKTAEILGRLNIANVLQLRNIGLAQLENIFGKSGVSIYQKARGVDDSPVLSNEPIKSIGQEHTFEIDTRDPEDIFGAFERILKNVHQAAFKQGFSFKTITVVCRFQGFETHTKSKTLGKSSSDFKILRNEANKLLLKFLMENLKPIRLVGLRLSNLSSLLKNT